MAKKVIQMRDRYKSTTRLYPKITMGSLSPDVKAYIESQGGGGTEIPTLTITQEQYSGGGILLTQEQYDLIIDKDIIIFNSPHIGKRVVMSRIRWDGEYSESSSTPQTTVVFQNVHYYIGENNDSVELLQLVIIPNQLQSYFTNTGTQLGQEYMYNHVLDFKDSNNVHCYATIPMYYSEPLDESDVINYLYDNGITSLKGYPCTGQVTENGNVNTFYTVHKIYATSNELRVASEYDYPIKVTLVDDIVIE